MIGILLSLSLSSTKKIKNSGWINGERSSHYYPITYKSYDTCHVYFDSIDYSNTKLFFIGKNGVNYSITSSVEGVVLTPDTKLQIVLKSNSFTPHRFYSFVSSYCNNVTFASKENFDFTGLLPYNSKYTQCFLAVSNKHYPRNLTFYPNSQKFMSIKNYVNNSVANNFSLHASRVYFSDSFSTSTDKETLSVINGFNGGTYTVQSRSYAFTDGKLLCLSNTSFGIGVYHSCQTPLPPPSIVPTPWKTSTRPYTRTPYTWSDPYDWSGSTGAGDAHSKFIWAGISVVFVVLAAVIVWVVHRACHRAAYPREGSANGVDSPLNGPQLEVAPSPYVPQAYQVAPAEPAFVDPYLAYAVPATSQAPVAVPAGYALTPYEGQGHGQAVVAYPGYDA